MILIATQGSRRLYAEVEDPSSLAIIEDTKRGTKTHTGVSVAAVLNRGYWDFVGPDDRSKLEKHYGPGPHPGTGTEQTVHGHGGGGGPSAPPPSPVRYEDFVDSWAQPHPSDLTENGQVFYLDTGRTTMCSKCGLPAWEIPAGEQGRYGNPPGAKYTHIGTAYGPIREDGSREQVNIGQTDEGQSYIAPIMGQDGMVFTRKVDHRPEKLLPIPDEVSDYQDALRLQQNTALNNLRLKQQAETKAKREAAKQKRAKAKAEADHEIRFEDKEIWVDPLVAKGEVVAAKLVTELEKSQAIRDEIQDAIDAEANLRQPLNAQRITANSERREAIAMVAKYEASRYPGADQWELQEVLESEARGATVRERLDSWRAQVTGKSGSSEPLEVKGTKFQNDALQDSADSGSEDTDAVILSGVRFEDGNWIIPDKEAAAKFRSWADDRYAYAYTSGERRSFETLRDRIQVGITEHGFIGSGTTQAEETFWEISGPRPDAGSTAVHPDAMIRSDWLLTAKWDSEARVTREVFSSDSPTWDSTMYSSFLVRSSFSDSGPDRYEGRESGVYRSEDIVDALLIQVDYFEPRYNAAQEGTLASRERSMQLYQDAENVHVGIVQEVLGEYRPFGERVDTKGHTGRSVLIQDISELYPSAWVGQSNANKDPISVQTKTRAEYSHYDKVVRLPKQGSVSEREMNRITTHELGHHFEHTVENVARAERIFYNYRTQGESVQKLQNLAPRHGYRSHETSKPDKFTDPYMGRNYGNDRSYELLSMAVPKIYGFDRGADPFSTTEPFGMDPEMTHFILGLLTEV